MKKLCIVALLAFFGLRNNTNAQSFQWAKAMDGISNDIATDAFGNVYTTGYFKDTADFDPGAGIFNLIAAGSAGGSEIFISKLDAAGNFVWAKQMGGTGHDRSHSIALDASGNVYTTGSFWGVADFDPGAGIHNLISVGGVDIFISKLDSDGNFIWAKAMGGIYNDDDGYSISIDDSGNVYTTGSFSATTDFNPGTGTFNLTPAGVYDIFISKLDAAGNFVWAKAMGGIAPDYGNSIAIDAYGNVYIMGVFWGTADFDPGVGTFNLTSEGTTDIFISKLNASGYFVGAIQMNFGASMTLDVYGNVYITGSFLGTGDFDPGVGTFHLFSTGESDVFINKLDATGNFIWAKAMGGIGDDFGISITVDASGAIYTTGYFSGTADFDPGAGIFNLTSAGTFDIFISKLDAAGNFVWAKSMGGTSDDGGSSIVIDASGNVYTTGSFFGTADFDPGTGTFNLTSASGNDFFVHKMGATVGLNDLSLDDEAITIYPNPTAGKFNVQCSEFNIQGVEIYNVLGECVYQSTNQPVNRSTIIDISDKPAGAYFLQIKTEKGMMMKKKLIINK